MRIVSMIRKGKCHLADSQAVIAVPISSNVSCERRNHESTLAGLALRRADVTQATGVHIDRRADAGPWHRREHCDLQRHQRADPESAAYRRIRACGRDLANR